jgi:hypothetical protein
MQPMYTLSGGQVRGYAAMPPVRDLVPIQLMLHSMLIICHHAEATLKRVRAVAYMAQDTSAHSADWC